MTVSQSPSGSVAYSETESDTYRNFRFMETQNIHDRVKKVLSTYRRIFNESDDGLFKHSTTHTIDKMEKTGKMAKQKHWYDTRNSALKLAQYEDFKRHSIMKAGDLEAIIPAEIINKSEENRKKSKLELMAEERDMKRRRQSYKGKSSQAGRSYTEVLRDTIQQQTQMLRDLYSSEIK